MYPTHCRNVDELGGKSLVMNLVNHGNSEVRMQALLAIQKMMVQNWWVHKSACIVYKLCGKSDCNSKKKPGQAAQLRVVVRKRWPANTSWNTYYGYNIKSGCIIIEFCVLIGWPRHNSARVIALSSMQGVSWQAAAGEVMTMDDLIASYIAVVVDSTYVL